MLFCYSPDKLKSSTFHVVVEFKAFEDVDGTKYVDLVPKDWLTNNFDQGWVCLYPDEDEYYLVNGFTKNFNPPEPYWESFPVDILKESSSYIRGMSRLKRSFGDCKFLSSSDTSSSETTSGNVPENVKVYDDSEVEDELDGIPVPPLALRPGTLTSVNRNNPRQPVDQSRQGSSLSQFHRESPVNQLSQDSPSNQLHRGSSVNDRLHQNSPSEQLYQGSSTNLPGRDSSSNQLCRDLSMTQLGQNLSPDHLHRGSLVREPGRQLSTEMMFQEPRNQMTQFQEELLIQVRQEMQQITSNFKYYVKQIEETMKTNQLQNHVYSTIGETTTTEAREIFLFRKVKHLIKFNDTLTSKQSKDKLKSLFALATTGSQNPKDDIHSILLMLMTHKVQ